MKHFPIQRIGLLWTMLFFLFCCTEDKELLWKAKEEREIQTFFETDGLSSRSFAFLDNLVSFIVEVLKEQDNLLNAVRHYRTKYGIPLWRHSVGITVNDGYQLFVPVYKESHPDEILSIWHFLLSSDKIQQYTLVRTPEDVLLETTWKYDYFTIYALEKRPKSGVTFRSSVQSRADAVSFDCQVAYIGAEYEGVYVEWPADIYCWEVDGGGIPLPPTNPDDEFLPEISVEDGWSDGLGGGGGGSSSGGSSSSGSAPMAEAIFRNSNMTDTNWQIIERMLEKIVRDCMGENLYNGLKEKLNGKTLAIEFINNAGSSFYFDGETSKIKLSIENMESNHLMHEMFHAFQAYQETWSSYVDAGLNLEIEAHYAQYLYLKKLPEYPGSKWSSRYVTDKRHQRISLLESVILPNGLMVIGATDNELNVEMDSIVRAFRRDSAYSEDNCKYNVDRTGLHNFENINKLTKNCDL